MQERPADRVLRPRGARSSFTPPRTTKSTPACIFADALATGRRVLFPRVARATGQLLLVRVVSPAELAAGRFRGARADGGRDRAGRQFATGAHLCPRRWLSARAGIVSAVGAVTMTVCWPRRAAVDKRWSGLFLSGAGPAPAVAGGSAARFNRYRVRRRMAPPRWWMRRRSADGPRRCSQVLIAIVGLLLGVVIGGAVFLL